jgi:hypothetical protein
MDKKEERYINSFKKNFVEKDMNDWDLLEFLGTKELMIRSMITDELKKENPSIYEKHREFFDIYNYVSPYSFYVGKLIAKSPNNDKAKRLNKLSIKMTQVLIYLGSHYHHEDMPVDAELLKDKDKYSELLPKGLKNLDDFISF